MWKQENSLQTLRLPPVPHRPWRFTEFPILAWWGPPGTAREADFRAYKDAGFTLYCANPDSGFPRAMDMAARVRIPVMAYRQRQGFVLPAPETPVDYTRYRENIVGWITNDEPGGYPAVMDAITAVNALMREDPTRWALFNLLPPGAQNNPTTEPVIEAAVRNGMPLLSYDSYVIHADGTDNAGAHFGNLERFRQASLRYNVPFWAFALTIRHFAYRRTSESDLRWTHYTNLAYGAKGLWYFTYWGPSDWEGWDRVAIVDPKDGTPTPLYGWVRALNYAVRDMGKTLLRLTSTGVFHTAPPPGQAGFPFGGGQWISDLRARDALVGFFRDPGGVPYALVVNKRHGKDQSAAAMADEIELTVAPTVRALTAVNWLDGKPGRLRLQNNKVTLRVAGGTGVLLRAEG